MVAVFTMEEQDTAQIGEQIEICWKIWEAQMYSVDSEEKDGHGRAVLLSKPESPRGRARKASRGKRHGRWRPSHPTAPRLLAGNLAEWSRYRDEVHLAVDLQEPFTGPCPQFFWECDDGSPIVHHPSCAGAWWEDCRRREADARPSCAMALLDSVRETLARREDELLMAIIRHIATS